MNSEKASIPKVIVQMSPNRSPHNPHNDLEKDKSFDNLTLSKDQSSK